MRKLAALMLFAVAATLALLDFVALIDPAGTKKADDLDPFGNPHISWFQHAAFIFAIIALASIACWLWRAKRRRNLAG